VEFHVGDLVKVFSGPYYEIRRGDVGKVSDVWGRHPVNVGRNLYGVVFGCNANADRLKEHPLSFYGYELTLVEAA
jgi:hypothetical protein